MKRLDADDVSVMVMLSVEGVFGRLSSGTIKPTANFPPITFKKTQEFRMKEASILIDPNS